MSQRSVSDALANSMKIRAHFKHSQLAQSLLEDLQHEMQGAGTTTTPARLVQDVQREATSLCRCCRPQLAGNTVSQRVLEKKAVTVLEPFEELTRTISSATTTGADVIPAVIRQPFPELGKQPCSLSSPCCCCGEVPERSFSQCGKRKTV